MASRWFVFWIACFTIAMIRDWDSWWLFLLLAALTGDPMDWLERQFKDK